MTAAAAGVDHFSLVVLFGCLGFALVGGWLSIEARRTDLRGNDPFSSTFRTLPSLTASLPAFSSMFFGWALMGAVADLGGIGNAHPGTARATVITIISALIGVASFGAGGVGLSLAWWRRPRRFLPPYLKTPEETAPHA